MHVARRLATISVSPGSNTLKAAYDSASEGDTLVLADGTYTGTYSSGVFTAYQKGMTIRAQNAGQVILNGQGARRVMTINAAALVLEGLKITLGNAGGDHGGGLRVLATGSATLTNCDIYENTASNGGGISAQDSSVSLTDCNIYKNTAWWGGGVYTTGTAGTSKSITITNCNIYENTANQGAGIRIAETIVTLTGCYVYKNTGTTLGGGISAVAGALVLRSTTFWDNTASASGACALYVKTAVSGPKSELFNNTFLTGTVSCSTGQMISYEATTGFTCTALGEWMPATPFSSPLATFTGCRFKCNPGTYGSSFTLTDAACTAPCTVGHYCPQGSAAPTPCPANTYMDSTGASVCTNCPTFATTTTTGATSIAACHCIRGYYTDTDVSGATICSVCPEGATTAAAGATGVSQCTCAIQTRTHSRSLPTSLPSSPSSTRMCSFHPTLVA